MKKFYLGFTLAEVLITLAIIGVVAAMTLPTLIQNQQKRSLEVATQKFYSNMSQAVKKYMADEGVDDLRNTPLTAIDDDDAERAQKACEDFVQKYLKVAKVCKDGCFADNYKAQNKKILDAIGNKSNYEISYWGNLGLILKGKFMLLDGSTLDIVAADIEYWPINIYVDINGQKGPNQIGYDLWSMSIFYDGSIDEGSVTPECKKDNEYCNSWGHSPKEIRDNRFDMCKYDDGGAYGGCFGHFLENGFKFDY